MSILPECSTGSVERRLQISELGVVLVGLVPRQALYEHLVRLTGGSHHYNVPYRTAAMPLGGNSYLPELSQF